MSTPGTTTVAPAGTWALDPVHSTIGFEVSYLAGKFRGQFREFSGSLGVDDAGRATLEGTAKVRSVDAKDENLSAHLQSPEFFDAERHPELRFRAEDIRLDGESATVQGEITIKGTTRPLTATGTAAGPMTDAFGNERINLNLTATVDRTEFGLNWNMPLPTGQPALANEVTIVTELHFTKAG
jgi:polyisoprenoid-binding protein YceI